MSLEDCQKEVEKGVLGISGCNYDQDYWAGAIKECGKIENMPKAQHLALIATYVYNQPISTHTSGLTMDRERISSLGFTSFVSGFRIWGNTPRLNTGVDNSASFNTSNYAPSYFTRNTSGIWAMCVTEE